MSEDICHRDQDRLDYIFEQVKALSQVVDELRTEVSDLKKVSLSTKREDILFECTKVNCEIDHVGPCAVGNMRTYLRNIGDSTTTEKICQLVENNQVPKSASTSPSYMIRSKTKRNKEPSSCKSPPAKNTLSTVYKGINFFKNKLVKMIHSVPAPQLLVKSTRNNCFGSNGKQQIRFPRKEEKKKLAELDGTNGNDVFECVDVNEELDDSTDISDASAQAVITICSRQEDDKKSTHSSSQDVTGNIVQVSPLSLMSDNRPITRSNCATDWPSKGRVKRAFLQNKSRKYKICSCGSQCHYALYKLPCCEQNNTREKKTDNEVGRLTFERSNSKRKNHFPKFVNIEAEREEYNEQRLTDFRVDESSSSSLSVDLSVDVCGDYDKLEENVVDGFSKRGTMTHVMRGTNEKRNDNAISHFRTENELLMRVNLEANRQGYRARMEDFTHDYRSIRSNDKQVQCSSATLRATRRMPVGTSTPDSWRSGSMNRSDMTNRFDLIKVITPRRMKMNTQTERRSHFNCLRSIDSPAALDLGNERHMKNIDKDGNKEMLRTENACDMCDSPRQKARPRTEGYNAQFALRTEEDGEINSKKSWNPTGRFSYQRDETPHPKTSCPYHCDRVLAEVHKNLATLMSRFAEYHSPPHRTLDFDTSNVSGRRCLERVKDIIA